MGVFIVTVSYIVPAVYADDGLVAHWKLDEGTGTTALDDSGNGWNGTISNTAYSTTTPDVDFYDPYSLYFNPSNSGRIVNTNLSLNGYTQFTVAGWAYPTAANTRASWFGQNDVIEFGFTDGDTLFCYTAQGEASWDFNPSTFLNHWHNITCLGDGSHLIIYIDGTDVASSTAPGSGGYGSSGDHFTIGAGAVDGGTDGPFSGYIDDVRVYNRGLTPSEMAALGTGDAGPGVGLTLSGRSPEDNETGVALGVNLVATFSTSTIATSTGSIAIYKTSDDSLVESIPVNSNQISKSGADITINPNANFEESTNYYVFIPSTAFKDAADTFYDGTFSSSTWNFTTGDFTAPTISSLVASSTASTSVSVTWTTSEAASSRIYYGPTTEYGLQTSETDTSPRVTSHNISLASLLPCTIYHYEVTSADASVNFATSSDSTFTTIGCEYEAEVIATSSTLMTSSTGGTSSVSTSGKTFSVTAPAHATASSSSFVIQIKAIPSQPVLDAYGHPDDATHEVGATVFDVKAIIDGDTVLDSFDTPITIRYAYTDDEINNLNESSLWLYHYHNGSWYVLDDCSIDTGANSISCTTDSFSVFGLFGDSASVSATSGSSGKGASIQSRVANFIAMGNMTAAEALKSQWPTLFPLVSSDSNIPVRDLTIGMTGEDVRALQRLLMDKGYSIPAGSTAYFGVQTRAALASYQKEYDVFPSVGYFGPITRGQMKGVGITGLWW